MNQQPVTLRSRDSISLTTGVVTRSVERNVDLPADGVRNLYRNDLRTLHLAIMLAPYDVVPAQPQQPTWTPESVITRALRRNDLDGLYLAITRQH